MVDVACSTTFFLVTSSAAAAMRLDLLGCVIAWTSVSVLTSDLIDFGQLG